MPGSETMNLKVLSVPPSSEHTARPGGITARRRSNALGTEPSPGLRGFWGAYWHWGRKASRTEERFPYYSDLAL